MDDESKRAAWLEARRQGIGGSDAAAVCGVDPWKDALTIWSQKVGLLEPEDLSENEAVESGIALERAIGEWYAKKFSRKVIFGDPYAIRRSATHPFMCATLDAMEDRNGEPLVVQIKNTSYGADQWEEKLPLHYEIQLQHEMMVAGTERGVLVALHRGQALRAYERRLTSDIAASLVQIESDFWKMVESQTPPEAGPHSSDTVRQMFPKVEIEDLVALCPEADALDAELQEVRAKIDALSDRREAIESQIKAWIGRHAGGVTPQGVRFSWKGSVVHYKPKEASEAYVRRFTRSAKK